MTEQHTMAASRKVAVEQLNACHNGAELDFATTAEVAPLHGTIAQERALHAIETGLTMAEPGFNIFASGSIGTGRNSTLKAMVEDAASRESVPSDWVYVYNFDYPDAPMAIEMPTGKARQLAQDMEELIRDCQSEIPKAFEDQEYGKQKNQTMQKLQEQRNQLFDKLQDKARKLSHDVKMTPGGLMTVPLYDGQALSPHEFDSLDETIKDELRQKNKQVQEIIAETFSEARKHEKTTRREADELERRVALFAVGHLIEDLTHKYSALPRVAHYLAQVQEHIVDNIEVFKDGQEQVQGLPAALGGGADQSREVLDNYKVNVVVDHSHTDGAPVIDERNPTYYNLLGQLEYRAQFGGMTTDFSMIKVGSVQRASGGYLILQAWDLLRNPFAWEGLKRTLRTQQASIENMWEQYQALPAARLRPEAIPVDLKVILVGSPMIYHLLYQLDEDFRRLFKIKADFDTEMDKTAEHVQQFASFISAKCKANGLPPFDRSAVQRLLENSHRLAGHQKRLSTCFLATADLVSEAGERARAAGANTVNAEHVQQAMLAIRERSRMVHDKMQRLIAEGVLLIDTADKIVGQANGLAVYDLGDYRFGMPVRITCVSSVGRAGVVNIERESKMSGSLHDKGVLILTGFMAANFGQDKPLSLSASLCFEQSYAGVDGDSASCTELYALLSSLADVPLRQDIAVTGSVNQRGQIQPIGGVNEKIEGFFEICQDKGLTGSQGVMIPARNVENLMLHKDVIEAVQNDQFQIYAVDSIDQGIEILTGMPAGTRNAQGRYPDDSVYGKVDRRLREMADLLRQFVALAGGVDQDEAGPTAQAAAAP